MKQQKDKIALGSTELEALINYLGLVIYRGDGIAKDTYFCEPKDTNDKA